MRKDVQKVVDYARSLGYEHTRTTRHIMLCHSSGTRVTLPQTPSDGRSLENALADLRRGAGVRKDGVKAGRSRHKKGSGYDPTKSMVEQTASQLNAQWQAEIAIIDEQLADIKEHPIDQMERAEELVCRRIHLADLLRRNYQPVPDLDI